MPICKKCKKRIKKSEAREVEVSGPIGDYTILAPMRLIVCRDCSKQIIDAGLLQASLSAE